MKDISSDLGNIRVHKDVMRGVIFNTISEIPGVVRIHHTLLERILRLFRPSKLFPIRIYINPGNEKINIRIPLIVRFGENIPKLGGLIQERVANSLREYLENFTFQIDVDIRGLGKKE